MTAEIASGHAALRRGRVSTPGTVYLVTFSTFRRAPVFLEHERAMRASRAFIDQRLWVHSHLLAWVLMPDHWHGLIRLGGKENLSGLVGRLKANSARKACGNDEKCRVWARAFHDRAMRTEESLEAVARYLVLNPVRAGLVSNPRAYPFWDAIWLRPRAVGAA